MIDKIKKILKHGDALSEDASDYDGAFSYAAESHAFTLGIYDGLRKLKPASSAETCRPDNEDVQQEPHYYAGGYVLGTFLQFCLVATATLFTYVIL